MQPPQILGTGPVRHEYSPKTVESARTTIDTKRTVGQANPGFSRISQLSTTLATVRQIEDLIRNGQLKPGDRLPPERELSTTLGVSRPTVREAVRALSLLGIIQSRHGSGTYIGDLDTEALDEPLRWLLSLSLPAQDISTVLGFRMAVESGLARMAASRISDDAISELGELLTKLRAAKTDQTVLRTDMQMHGLIAQEAGNPLLEWVLSAVAELNALARSRTIRAEGIKPQVADDQALIVAALQDRDPVAAGEAMWRHLERILDGYRAATEAAAPSTPGEPDSRQPIRDA